MEAFGNDSSSSVMEGYINSGVGSVDPEACSSVRFISGQVADVSVRRGHHSLAVGADFQTARGLQMS